VDGTQATPQHGFQPLKHPAVLERQALKRCAHDGAVCLRYALICGAAELADTRRHVPGTQELVRIGIDQRTEGRRFGGQASEVVVRVFLPFCGPGATALLHQPQAHDVLEQPVGATDAALVGKVVRQALGSDDRLTHLHAHQGPGPRTDVAKVVPFGRHGSDGRARVVAGRSQDGHCIEPGLIGDIVPQKADGGARLHHRQEYVSRQIEAPEQIPSPIAGTWVEALCGGRVGELAGLDAGKPVVEEVGHHQKGTGHTECTVPLAPHGEQLVQGVDFHELDARLVENDLARHDAKRGVQHALGTGIPVVARIAE